MGAEFPCTLESAHPQPLHFNTLNYFMKFPMYFWLGSWVAVVFWLFWSYLASFLHGRTLSLQTKSTDKIIELYNFVVLSLNIPRHHM